MPKPRLSVTIGMTIGKWTLIDEANPNSRGQRIMVCACECGVTKTVILTHLFAGRSKSCGCGKAESIGNAHRIHGESGHSRGEYRVWDGIIQRCENPKHTEFHSYGGRGISICNRWRESYELFLLDMGRRPSRTHSIDRIDTNGNYEKDNCKWSTQKEQCRNVRHNVCVMYNGNKRLFIEICEELGIKYGTAYDQLKRGRPNGPKPPFTLWTE